MNNKKNKLNNRKLIYNFISENPGVYQIEISKALKISASTVNYHLHYLKKKGLITKQKENRYIRYYLSEKISSFEKKVLNILRQETPCNIVLYLIIETCASQIELSKRLEKHPSTITFHLKKLLDMNIIERLFVENGKIIAPRLKEPKFVEYDPVSNDAVYKLKNLNEICNLLFTYKKSFSNNSRIIATINVLEYAKKRRFLDIVPNKISKKKAFVENAIEYVYEIFPHPYYG